MAEKLNMATTNIADKNFEVLSKLFPNALTETITGYDENGNAIIERAIDADVLRQEISCKVVEGRDERYQFTWPDKKKSVILANAPISDTLRPCEEESVNFNSTENLYIEGDNLDVLKLLHETYLEKIKMIYIDPPYNTGKDFIYADDYTEGLDSFLISSSQVDNERNRLVQNTDGNGRFHTDWLNMIYPRLHLAKDLLSNEGVIFISIDENEYGSLLKVCSEIFGTANYVGTIILQTATDNNPRQINIEHEYVIVFAKNKSIQDYWQAPSEKAKLIQIRYMELKEKYCNDIKRIQNELRKWIKTNESILEGVTHYDNVDEKGVFHDGDIANTVFGGYKYDVIHPITGKVCKIPDKGFRFAEATMRSMIANNEIMFGADETTLIKPKKRLENCKDVLRSIIYEDGRISTKKFEQLMARDIFQNPKSDTVIQRLINFIVKDGDIVLDFFSGSGTTAEAVMNSSIQMKQNIKFIMVQLPEDLDESIETADSRAKKTLKNAITFLDEIGKKHTICEIGKERIRRAAIRIKESIDNEEQLHYLDGGFRVLKLDTSNMKDVYYNPSQMEQQTLFASTDNIKEDRTPEDLLFQVMLDLGVLLSSKIEEKVIAGKKVFNVAEGFLIACFDSDITEETVKAVAQEKPYYAVFRDSSMANDSVATNFEQIFATYSPETVRKVL